MVIKEEEADYGTIVTSRPMCVVRKSNQQGMAEKKFQHY